MMSLLLMLSTHLIWLPTDEQTFPLIPLFAALCSAPLIVDWGLTIGLVGGLMIQLFFLNCHRYGDIFSRALVILCGVGLVCLNQHRLQPWFYQLLIFSIIFGLGGCCRQSRHSVRRQISQLQFVVISIYVYSAIGKFDFEFLHTVGQQFLTVLLRAGNIEIGGWAWSSRLFAAAFLPLAELMLASMLAIGCYGSPQLTKLGAVIACAFHVTLMVIFGLGLGHSSGVVLWNLQFAVQALLLFGLPAMSPASAGKAEVEPAVNRRPCFALITGNFLVAIVVFMPLLERVGYWDHWPSWALYAPHSSRVEVRVAPAAVKLLPYDLQALIDQPKDESVASVWVRVPLAQWSLNSLRTPIYPQARFELGVLRGLARQIESDFSIQATVLSSANRFTGKRKLVEIQGKSRIDRATELFFFNTRPRF